MNYGFAPMGRAVVDRLNSLLTPLQFRLAVLIYNRTNFKDGEAMAGNKLITIHRGQFMTSLRSLAILGRLSIQQARTALKRYEAIGFLTCESTNKFRILTIVNYGVYEDSGGSHQQAEQHASNKQATDKQQAGQQASNKLATTIEERRESKKEKTVGDLRLQPPPKSDSQKSVASKTKPFPEHATFIEFFQVQFQKYNQGAKPTWNGRTGKLVSQLLKAHGLQECKRRTLVMFESPPAWLNPPFDVGTLSQHFDKFVPVTSKPKRNDPFAGIDEEEDQQDMFRRYAEQARQP